MKIGNIAIGGENCFVIAEIGHNHQGSVEICKQMIKAAKDAGADAVKLQKRNNKTLFTEEAYNKSYENENSFGKTYGEHREALEFDKEQYLEVIEYAKQIGIILFATPFDIESVDFLEELDIPCYKIASAMVDDIPLIKRVAQTSKPVFLSTGASTNSDIDYVYKILKDAETPLCLMHCVSAYPMVNYEEANLLCIKTMKDRYPDAIIGLSSHDNGIVLPVASYVLGARVVEKHFTLNRAMKGTDQSFSLEPLGLSKMVRDLKRVKLALGDGIKRMQPSEIEAKRKLGKSIYAKVSISRGEVITERKICCKCPGGGLSPIYFSLLIGKKAIRNIGKEEKFIQGDLCD